MAVNDIREVKRQFKQLVITEVVRKETGQKAVAIWIKDAGAYVVFENADQVAQLAKLLDRLAAQMGRKRPPVLTPEQERIAENILKQSHFLGR